MATTLSRAEVEKKVREILERWPLYRMFEYPDDDSPDYLPDNISMFCPSSLCGKEQIFREKRQYQVDDKSGFGKRVYECKNCNSHSVHFAFYWFHEGGKSCFFKYGQYPPPEERIPEALRTTLDKEDLTFYKTAIRLRNFGLGIGAVSYLRRVVENRMNDILDLLAGTAREKGGHETLLKALAEVKADRRFDPKVELAGKLLPERLRPPGLPNPIDRLHDLASEALHRKSEDEALETFDICRTAFEYVFGQLSIEKAEAEAYLVSLRKLSPTSSGPKNE